MKNNKIGVSSHITCYNNKTTRYKINNSGIKNVNYFKDPLLTFFRTSPLEGVKYDSIYRDKGYLHQTTCRDSLLGYMSRAMLTREVPVKEIKIGICVENTNDVERDMLRKNLRRSIKILNSIEKNKGWSSSKLELFEGDKIEVLTVKGKVSVSKEFNSYKKHAIIAVYSPSKEWFMYQHMISMFISIARMTTIGLYDGIISYSGFKKRSKSFVKTIGFLSNVKSKDSTTACSSSLWSYVIDNAEKIYTEKDTKAFMAGDVSGSTGILTLSLNVFNKLWKKDKGKTIMKLHKKGIGPCTEEKYIKDKIIHNIREECKAAEKLANIIEKEQ